MAGRERERDGTGSRMLRKTEAGRGVGRERWGGPEALCEHAKESGFILRAKGSYGRVLSWMT